MKYRFLIIAVFLIISCQNVFSQNDFAIGFNIIPAITYSFSPSYLPSPKDNFGYSFGMNGVYFIEPNLFMETGLNYQNKKLLYAKDILDTRKAWIDVNGNGIIDAEDRLDYSCVVPSDYSNKYSSISLPITVNYRTSKIKTTSFIGSFGLSLNYIYNIEEISKSNQYGENTEGNHSTNDFTSSLTIGIALFQPITDYIILITGPKYFYDFYSNQKNFQVKFHTFGLEIKLYYML